MTESADGEGDDALLAEIVEKSVVGIGAFMSERALLAGFAYLVTGGLGAAAYGFVSVFIRGETISRNLVAGLGDGYSRTLPRVSTPAQRTLLSIGSLGFVAVWAVTATLLVVFRGPIVDVTLLQPRHESLVALFALGLLPFLLLRNLRDVFRGLRMIRLAMLVSRLFKPITLLAGAALVLALRLGDSLLLLWGGVTVAALGLTVVGGVVLRSTTGLRPGSVRSHRQVVRKFLVYTANATGVAVLELVQRRAVFVVMALALSPVAAGAFSLSLVLGRAVRWPLSGVNGILPPIAAELYGDDREETLQRLYVQTSRLATVVTTPVLVVGFAFAPELLGTFDEAYVAQAAVLRAVLVAQFVATVFGSVGLLLLMTDNERISLLTQVLNASIAVPLMIVLTVRFGPLGLGVAFLLSLVVNNTTELLVLFFREGLVPFSREQLYAALSAVPTVLLLLATKTAAGTGWAVLAATLVTGGYIWLSNRVLLQRSDRAAVRAWLN
ncbi:MAG: membrane protein involved in the export of O-antigen and teichoic acid [halophilic archaeon J07HX64]|jgi:Membrane protein involved in the export of O-antigen and teichoic acid|nr:MAG: membrane protein involved in the export of O-antigen and teichoic acid [halophilic archaeon J07HX64]